MTSTTTMLIIYVQSKTLLHPTTSAIIGIISTIELPLLLHAS